MGFDRSFLFGANARADAIEREAVRKRRALGGFMHDTTALSDQRNTTVWTQGRLLLGAFLGVSIGISSLYFYSLGPLMKPIAATYG